MEENIKTVVETYQCPGCVCGCDIDCYEKGDNVECGKHAAGTNIYPDVGKIFLGMPTGFCRTGNIDNFKIFIFEELSKGWGYDKYNVPVWKHLDENGNTMVRGISPRVNRPFIHIFIGDCMSGIDCFEITKEDLDGMD